MTIAICSICKDNLMDCDNIYHTECGHVFHYHCLGQWLERSKSCPQCRDKVTRQKIHRLHLTLSSSQGAEEDSCSLKEKIQNLEFKIRLKEKDIQYYTSKNITLDKQNDGLKREVRKVESELRKQSSTLYQLEMQHESCSIVKKELIQMKCKVDELKPLEILFNAPVGDVMRMVGNTKDPDTLIRYISVLKKEFAESINKRKKLCMTLKKCQEDVAKANSKYESLQGERSKRMELEEKLAFSESRNMALQKRVEELEKILGINESDNIPDFQGINIEENNDDKNDNDEVITKPVEAVIKDKKKNPDKSRQSILPSKRKERELSEFTIPKKKKEDANIRKHSSTENHNVILQTSIILYTAIFITFFKFTIYRNIPIATLRVRGDCHCQGHRLRNFVYKWLTFVDDTLSFVRIKMSSLRECIITPWEIETYIQSLQTSQLEDIGTKGWYEFHKRLMLLNQQSVLEVNTLREESVKELFVSYKKIPILIYEAIQIHLWKHKVFPLLLQINSEPQNTFMFFTVLYHEDLAVSLLESVLFHCESTETIEDTALDLVDYAITCVYEIVSPLANEVYENVKKPNSCIEEILERKKELKFDIGMRCISILRYLAEFSDNLPLSILSRMLSTHDVPYLLVDLIENRPWIKTNDDGENMVYDGSWKKIKSGEEEKVSKIEGQVWIGLRELLLNPKSAPYYELTEYRLTHLMKLQKYLHETVLDQISPLLDLKRWLSCVSVSSAQSKAPRPPNVEVMLQIQASLLEKYHKKWKKLAKRQAKFLFTTNTEDVKSAAQILSDAYDLDKLDSIEMKECFLCQGVSQKRCSKCKSAWYCGRECQVKDWTKHKVICDKITKHEECKQQN
ncbi:zinc finger MYND-type containing 10 [Augochlora pura]